MPDLETLLRSTLIEQAEQITPRLDAVSAAKSVAEPHRRLRPAGRSVIAAAAVAAVAAAALSWHPFADSTTATMPPPANALTTAPATAKTLVESASGLGIDSPAPHPRSPDWWAAGAGGSAAILMPLFGSDYSYQPQSPSGWGGGLTLTPGSPSAAGLPAGYQAAATLNVVNATPVSGQGFIEPITTLCAALVEKGATTKACVPQTVGSLTVQRAETDAPNTKIGTWANLRILYQRPDGLVQYAEVNIWNTAYPTTVAERTQASTWLQAQNPKLAAAATANLG